MSFLRRLLGRLIRVRAGDIDPEREATRRRVEALQRRLSELEAEEFVGRSGPWEPPAQSS